MYLVQFIRGATFLGLVVLLYLLVVAIVNGIWIAALLAIPCAAMGIVILYLTKQIINVLKEPQ